MALAESMIGGDRSAGGAETASAYPESAASDRNSRSSMCSTAGKGGPKLSGQEQNAVVAKIGSAVKRSSSSEKKLPFQDDDTPNTKGARVKEMEVSSRLVLADNPFPCGRFLFGSYCN